MTAEQREPISDPELAERARNGDNEAFAELWRRHAAAGHAIARSVTSSIESDDLVAEAYGKIYALIKRGGGPTGAFRPYLAATIRNLASRIGRSRRETPIDFADDLIDHATSDEEHMRQLDRDLTSTAFKALPDRWQQALWYSEVEDMGVKDCAEIFGIKPAAMAMLTFRAREGLRDAWIQAHLKIIDPGSEHEWALGRLGAHARARLTKRDSTRLREHLDDCGPCSRVADEAHSAASRLAVSLLPALIGAGAAVAYLQEISNGATAAIAAPMAGALVPNWSASAALQGGLQQLQVLVGSSALVTIALATGATLMDDVSRTSPGAVNEQLSTSGPSAVPPSIREPAISVDGLTVAVDLGRLDLFYPIFTGVARPDSIVRISTPTAVVAELPVGNDGHWATDQLESLSSGALVFDNVADGSLVASGSTTVDLKAPTLSIHRSGSKVSITVRGIPGAGIAVTTASSTQSTTISAAILDRSGAWSATFEALPDADELAVRYAEGKRFGPSKSVTTPSRSSDSSAGR
ncbi:MAG: sigma-70 family RNA polymerase sigma factor [Leifsonia sp.]